MKRLSFAIVGSAALLLAACSGNNEDSVNESDANATQVDELNDLSTQAANDAANQLEAEALGNQAQQLEQEGTANAAVSENLTTTTDDEAMNVSGM